MSKTTRIITVPGSLSFFLLLTCSGSASAACPAATSTQTVYSFNGTYFSSMPSSYGIDISGSTVNQSEYNIVWSSGTTTDDYDFVADRRYSSSNHQLLSTSISNVCDFIDCYDFLGPRTDNINLLGIAGAWINGWSCMHTKPAFHFFGHSRNFGSDMTPFTDYEIQPFGVDDRVSFVDVAALPGIATAVVVGTPNCSDGIARNIRMAYIDTDGTVDEDFGYVVTSVPSVFYRYPSVTASLTAALPGNHPIALVVSWSDTSSTPGNVYFRIYAYNADTDTLDPINMPAIVGQGSLSDVAAVPDGFVVTWLTGSGSSRQVQMRAFDWFGVAKYPNPVVVSSVIGEFADPAIASAMWQIPGGSLQPYFVITYTRHWTESGSSRIGRYFRFFRNLASPSFITDETQITLMAGQSFYSHVGSEYRNAVDIFNNCDDRLVAGFAWLQTFDADRSLVAYKKFVSIFPRLDGLSGIVASAAPESSLSEPDQLPMVSEDSIGDRFDFNFSDGPVELVSPGLVNSSIGELQVSVPGCYDYRVGSCIGE